MGVNTVEILYIAGSLLVGLIAGGWIYRTFLADHRLRELESQMIDLQKEYTDYQSSVSAYFERTATLANQLTESYRDMHDHLRKGAQRLSAQPIAWSNRTSNAPSIEHHEIADEATPLSSPPRDY